MKRDVDIFLNDFMEKNEREEFFKRLLDVVPVPIFYEDRNGRYLGCNKAFADFMDKKPEEIVSRSVLDIVPPEQAQECFERDQQLLLRGGSVSEERKLLHHDGTYHTVLFNKTVFLNKKGEIIGLIGAFLDITEITEARRREQHYLKKLQILASSLSMATEAERRRIAKRLHDSIGQNLALSKLKLQMLREEITTEEAKMEIAKTISILDDCIDITRNLTFDLGIPVLYRLGLEATLSRIKERFRKKYSLEIDYTIDDNLPKNLSVGLETFLFRAVQELLMNIVKHAKTDRAEAEIKLDGIDTIELIVRDFGCGFDMDDIEDKGKDYQHYGLFSLQETLRLIGGSIYINSIKDYGTEVIIRVPVDAFDSYDESEGGDEH